MNAGAYKEKIQGNNSVGNLNMLLQLALTDCEINSDDYLCILMAVDRRVAQLADGPPKPEPVTAR